MTKGNGRFMSFVATKPVWCTCAFLVTLVVGGGGWYIRQLGAEQYALRVAQGKLKAAEELTRLESVQERAKLSERLGRVEEKVNALQVGQDRIKTGLDRIDGKMDRLLNR